MGRGNHIKGQQYYANLTFATLQIQIALLAQTCPLNVSRSLMDLKCNHIRDIVNMWTKSQYGIHYYIYMIFILPYVISSISRPSSSSKQPYFLQVFLSNQVWLRFLQPCFHGHSETDLNVHDRIKNKTITHC